MLPGANGLPDPAHAPDLRARRRRARSTSQIGPDGDLYYVDLDGGTIRRIRCSSATSAPTARRHRHPDDRRRAADRAASTARGSSDPDGDDAHLRLGPRRRRRSSTTRRRPTPTLHLHDAGHLHRRACGSPTRAALTDTDDADRSRAGTPPTRDRSPAGRRHDVEGRRHDHLHAARRPTSAAAPIAGRRPHAGDINLQHCNRTSDVLPHALAADARPASRRLVRRARPRVPVVPRARADRDATRSASRGRSPAGSTRRPWRLTLRVAARPASS